MIESSRLGLRLLQCSDVGVDYVSWLNDDDSNQYLESRFQRHTQDSVRVFVGDTLASENQHLYGIFAKETGLHIGNIKLGPINIRYSSAGIVLMIGKPYWRKGYATESIGLICEYAFQSVGLEKISAGCYEENLGSKRAFEKVGFSVEGFQKSQVISQGVRTGVWMLGLCRSDFGS